MRGDVGVFVTLLMALPDELCFSNAYQACLTCTVELLQHGNLPKLLPTPVDPCRPHTSSVYLSPRFTDAVDA